MIAEPERNERGSARFFFFQSISPLSVHRVISLEIVLPLHQSEPIGDSLRAID